MDPLLAVLSQPLASGRVVGIADDGLLAIRRADDDQESWCDRLDGGPAYEVGDEVVLCAPAGRERSVVIGRIGTTSAPAQPGDAPNTLVIDAREQLTLRCGGGSIIIRADGRIVIAGTDLVSHAKRLNRIRGGSVAIN
ncbi:MAG: hypothetical protein H0W83_02780 [Planctomycetes bacterium]|nr:hypothetical protein [Planctomycetota bacterium]